MEALSFNVSSSRKQVPRELIMQMSAGFLEGLVRGYKGALLSQNNYHNLTQCENLEGKSWIDGYGL